jgi:hypothetical protein
VLDLAPEASDLLGLALHEHRDEGVSDRLSAVGMEVVEGVRDLAATGVHQGLQPQHLLSNYVGLATVSAAARFGR